MMLCCSEWKKRDKAQRVQRERAEKKVGNLPTSDQAVKRFVGPTDGMIAYLACLSQYAVV